MNYNFQYNNAVLLVQTWSQYLPKTQLADVQYDSKILNKHFPVQSQHYKHQKKVEIYSKLIKKKKKKKKKQNDVNDNALVSLLLHCEKYCNFISFPGTEILWKGTVSAQFQAICPKLFRNCAFLQNVHTKKLGKNTAFFAVLTLNIFDSFFQCFNC